MLMSEPNHVPIRVPAQITYKELSRKPQRVKLPHQSPVFLLSPSVFSSFILISFSNISWEILLFYVLGCLLLLIIFFSVNFIVFLFSYILSSYPHELLMASL